MLRHLILTLIILFTLTRLESIDGQNETSIDLTTTPFQEILLTTTKLSWQKQKEKYLTAALQKVQAMKSNNTSDASVVSTKNPVPPPPKGFRQFVRCHQLSSIHSLPSPYACSYHFDAETGVCWKATLNGSVASSVIEYDHGQNHFYGGIVHGIENCTIERLCQMNGTWAKTVSPDIQCKTCLGDGRPVKFDSISIMIETMSLSLSLISLTIAVLCMMNVKYVSYFYVKVFRFDPLDVTGPRHLSPRPAKTHFLVIPPNTSLLVKCFLIFRRLHLPRNLLHMHLFVAFIFRSIVKLAFIHLIVGGYTRSMITYSRDKCGNIEITSKSSNLFHIIGCRTLSSLFWYTDAVSQTFIFCEAMFLFTALTSHLFRDRGCLPFVLWGWLSPLLWLMMWIASHIVTDRLKDRSTCWLEADQTAYFYYFFYVPYAFYLLVNFGIFLYLVRLLYSKYQSNNNQTSRTGNRHLIKSILILIPLFGLHSLLVMWVFYRKNEGHTIWYFISVIFKAIFGDLQGFFTSLIYFYFNTEIRYEVLRQVQRTILSSETVRRSSAGETLSTRLSTFRRSISRNRQSSVPNRHERRRPNTSLPLRPIQEKKKKTTTSLCPGWVKRLLLKKTIPDEPPKQTLIEQNPCHEVSPAVVPESIPEEDGDAVTSPMIMQIRASGGPIDTDGHTCDTVIMKNDHDDDELLSDENDVTIHLSSFQAEQTSSLSNHTPLLTRHKHFQRQRSNSEGHNGLSPFSSNAFADNKSLQ